MPSIKKSKKPSNRSDVSPLLLRLGLILVCMSGVLFLLIFRDVVVSELSYRLNPPAEYAVVTLPNEISNGGETALVAPDANFSLIIPKIGASSKVVANVDPYNSQIYQAALAEGVAHAMGTAAPNQNGNTFLFAHSTTNFYEATRFNALFYLLRKLEPNDEFYIIFEGEKYTYKVSNTEIVEPTAVEYLEQKDLTKKTATLMTCWPPGTTLKRLLVHGELQETTNISHN